MRNPRNEPLADRDIVEALGAAEGPERRCVLSGRHAGRDEMLRLAVSPPDPDGVSDVELIGKIERRRKLDRADRAFAMKALLCRVRRRFAALPDARRSPFESAVR